ncbi:MAG: hypothetical protein DWQ31_11505 [Planctomycetota bacterium]|nr:MAG: hypothetical protein DWQ31_11505 [Planctomycetota bacterium]REJ89315.1 MAG: hypothetical protein DWQ35_18435 [Planctomycetota bacterium]REK22890.1 MAG: hypothetical protein DWQ42_16400 [Planctomycetota bacterium]REK37410.1 MAG: hypothetical protein DWQ46_22275 [Planctomycetota bacterium]
MKTDTDAAVVRLSSARDRRLIVARPLGRLCNQLFLFAHLIGFARESHTRIVNLAFARYAHYFVGTQGDPLVRYPRVRSRLACGGTRRLAGWGGRHLYSLAKRLPGRFSLLRGSEQIVPLHGEAVAAALGERKPVVLQGETFRYDERVQQHTAAIREHLQLVPRHRDRVKETLERARRDCDVLIGAHIRQGDFRRWHGGRFHRSVAQFTATMEHTVSQFPNSRVAFLICSDEAVDASPFGDLQVHRSTGQIVEDLYALAGCDYLLGTPMSTYSMWASFYGNTPFFTVADDGRQPLLDDFHVTDLAHYASTHQPGEDDRELVEAESGEPVRRLAS